MDDHDENLVGTCPDMCPASERTTRAENRSLDPLEVVPGDVYETSIDLAVKSYARPAAGIEITPDLVRPIHVLEKTITHLESLLDSTEFDLSNICSFVSNRLRAIDQDLRVQALKTHAAVALYERMTLLYILLDYLQLDNDQPSSDTKLLRDQLSKLFTTLEEIYNSFPRNTFKNEIFFIVLTMLNRLGGCLNYSAETEVSIYFASWIRKYDPSEYSGNCQQVLTWTMNLVSSYFSKNFVEFFKLFKSANFPQAAVLLRIVRKFKRFAVQSLGIVKGSIPVSLVSSMITSSAQNVEDLARLGNLKIVLENNTSHIFFPTSPTTTMISFPEVPATFGSIEGERFRPFLDAMLVKPLRKMSLIETHLMIVNEALGVLPVISQSISTVMPGSLTSKPHFHQPERKIRENYFPEPFPVVQKDLHFAHPLLESEPVQISFPASSPRTSTVDLSRVQQSGSLYSSPVGKNNFPVASPPKKDTTTTEPLVGKNNFPPVLNFFQSAPPSTPSSLQVKTVLPPSPNEIQKDLIKELKNILKYKEVQWNFHRLYNCFEYWKVCHNDILEKKKLVGQKRRQNYENLMKSSTKFSEIPKFEALLKPKIFKKIEIFHFCEQSFFEILDSKLNLPKSDCFLSSSHCLSRNRLLQCAFVCTDDVALAIILQFFSNLKFSTLNSDSSIRYTMNKSTVFNISYCFLVIPYKSFGNCSKLLHKIDFIVGISFKSALISPILSSNCLYSIHLPQFKSLSLPIILQEGVFELTNLRIKKQQSFCNHYLSEIVSFSVGADSDLIDFLSFSTFDVTNFPYISFLYDFPEVTDIYTSNIAAKFLREYFKKRRKILYVGTVDFENTFVSLLHTRSFCCCSGLNCLLDKTQEHCRPERKRVCSKLL
ncbi:hypothetical protein RCL1_006727 [Eukaryota sp. TZLM3-RCL]